MQEVVVVGTVTGVRNDFACSGIDRLHFGTGAGSGEGSVLGGANGVEDLALLV